RVRWRRQCAVSSGVIPSRSCVTRARPGRLQAVFALLVNALRDELQNLGQQFAGLRVPGDRVVDDGEQVAELGTGGEQRSGARAQVVSTVLADVHPERPDGVLAG